MSRTEKQPRKKYPPGKHPNSLKNLTPGTPKPFPKGVSGNPAGRPPKHYSLLEAIKLLADKPKDFKISNPTNIEATAMAIWKRSDAGTMDAIKELLDRLDGKVPQSTAIQGDITLRVVYDDGN